MITAVLVMGCATSNVDSYVSPTYSASQFRNIAVMPVTNQRLNASQALETNRRFMTAFRAKHPETKIMAGPDAISIINEKNLVDQWNNFIVAYSQTGIPNAKTLKALAAALEVDSVVVGTMTRVREQDYSPYVYPYIEIELQYTMFDKNGNILWEATSGFKQEGVMSKPPMAEVVNSALTGIIEQLPD
jgi:hypothetical protein